MSPDIWPPHMRMAPSSAPLLPRLPVRRLRPGGDCHYGNGFGATNPKAVNGQVQSGAAPLVETPVITIGGANAAVAFAGLTATGLYQFNVTVPSPLPDGDAAVVAKIGGVSSPAPALITIKN